jgi:hypothetical protein
VLGGVTTAGSLTIDATRHHLLCQLPAHIIRSSRVVCELQRLDENDGSGSGTDDAVASASASASGSPHKEGASFTCPSSVSVLSEGVGILMVAAGSGGWAGVASKRGGVDGMSTGSFAGTPCPLTVRMSTAPAAVVSMSPNQMPSVEVVRSVLFPHAGRVEDMDTPFPHSDQHQDQQDKEQRKRKLITCTPRLPTDTSPLCNIDRDSEQEPLESLADRDAMAAGGGGGGGGFEECKEEAPLQQQTGKSRESMRLRNLIGGPMW